MIAPRKGRWTAKPLRPRAPLYAGLITAANALVFVKLAYVLAHRDLKSAPAWISCLQALAALAVVAFILVNEARILRRTQADAARSERPAGLEEFPAEVTVQTEGGAIGTDRGVVYFENGLLGFVGARTSFLLAEGDLERPQGAVLIEWDRLVRPLALNLDEGGASVTIRPLLGYGRGYRRALRRFLRERAPSDAPRQWPPLVAWKEQGDVPEDDSERSALLEGADLARRLDDEGEARRLRDEDAGATRHNTL